MALAPNDVASSAIRWSSVAIYMSSKQSFTCSYTRCITVLPLRSARTFAGKRVEAYRAGMIPTNCEEVSINVVLFNKSYSAYTTQI